MKNQMQANRKSYESVIQKKVEEINEMVQNMEKGVTKALREMRRNVLTTKMEFQEYQERMNKAMQDQRQLIL